MKITVISLLSALLAATTFALEPIRYFNGPGAQIPIEFGHAEFDLDGDRALDLSVFATGTICTMDIPPSICSSPIMIEPEREAEIISRRSDVTLFKPGDEIGPVPPLESQWRTNALLLAGLVRHFGVSFEWGGPVKEEDAYIAIRLKAIEGWYYGWIRARARNPIFVNASVEIVDWAFEMRANTPIRVAAAPVAPIAVTQSERAGKLRLQWECQINLGYQVQFKDTVDGPWENIDLAIIATGPLAVVDVPIVNASRFYRVVRAD